MKKLFGIILVGCMIFVMSACGIFNVSNGKKLPAPIKQTNHITIDGLCVDDSSVSPDDSSLRTVYLFYTLNAGEQDLTIDSKQTRIKIGDTTTYGFVFEESCCKYIPGYIYRLEEFQVSKATSEKIVLTYKVPEDALEHGKIITMDDPNLPDEEKIVMTTDEIKHFNGEEEIAKSIDPDGYARMKEDREDADAETTETVKELINGYYWRFYKDGISHKLEFNAENRFTHSTDNGESKSGTYYVKNKYIVCTYTTGDAVEIPYKLTDGDIELDLDAAFGLD